MSYVITFFAGMAFSAVAIFFALVHTDCEDWCGEDWCGCDGEGMAHMAGECEEAEKHHD